MELEDRTALATDHPAEHAADAVAREEGFAAFSPSASGVPSDQETTSAVLSSLAADGYRASFVPGVDRGTLRCTVCDLTSAAGEFEVVVERRMEGASDPDDMVLVVGARCPVCHISGAVVLGFGPASSDTDADLVSALVGR